jgi:hypothetical protein
VIFLITLTLRGWCSKANTEPFTISNEGLYETFARVTGAPSTHATTLPFSAYSTKMGTCASSVTTELKYPGVAKQSKVVLLEDTG